MARESRPRDRQKSLAISRWQGVGADEDDVRGEDGVGIMGKDETGFTTDDTKIALRREPPESIDEQSGKVEMFKTCRIHPGELPMDEVVTNTVVWQLKEVSGGEQGGRCHHRHLGGCARSGPSGARRTIKDIRTAGMVPLARGESHPGLAIGGPSDPAGTTASSSQGGQVDHAGRVGCCRC